jgi:hypothetical protein
MTVMIRKEFLSHSHLYTDGMPWHAAGLAGQVETGAGKEAVWWLVRGEKSRQVTGGLRWDSMGDFRAWFP